MIGGLWAVLMTDVLQFIILNLAVLFVVPLALHQVGGLGGFIEAAPEGFFDLVKEEKYSVFFLAGWAAIHFFMIGAEWAFVQRFLCVPTKKDARKSTFLFAALYLCSPLLWLLPPMIYRVSNPGADAEQAYILACQSVLPIGMVGSDARGDVLGDRQYGQFAVERVFRRADAMIFISRWRKRALPNRCSAQDVYLPCYWEYC